MRQNVFGAKRLWSFHPTSMRQNVYGLIDHGAKCRYMGRNVHGANCAWPKSPDTAAHTDGSLQYTMNWSAVSVPTVICSVMTVHHCDHLCPHHMVQLTILHLLHIMAKFPEFCVF